MKIQKQSEESSPERRKTIIFCFLIICVAFNAGYGFYYGGLSSSVDLIIASLTPLVVIPTFDDWLNRKLNV